MSKIEDFLIPSKYETAFYAGIETASALALRELDNIEGSYNDRKFQVKRDIHLKMRKIIYDLSVCIKQNTKEETIESIKKKLQHQQVSVEEMQFKMPTIYIFSVLEEELKGSK